VGEEVGRWRRGGRRRRREGGRVETSRADLSPAIVSSRIYMEAFLTCLPGERKERALIKHVSVFVCSSFETRTELKLTLLVSFCSQYFSRVE